MDKRLTLEFTHATYELGKRQFLNGLQPDVNTEPGSRFANLMQYADEVLDNKDGLFFQSIDGTLIISFQRLKSTMVDDRTEKTSSAGENPQNHKARRRERFANVFSCPVEDMYRASLQDVINKLEGNIVSYDRDIPGQFVLKVNQLGSKSLRTHNRDRETEGPEEFHDIKDLQQGTDTSTAEEQNIDKPAETPHDEAFNEWNNSQTTEDWDTVDDSSTSPPDSQKGQLKDKHAKFVAVFWEAYRRKDIQLQASIEDIDDFRTFVDGTLAKFNYISNERKRSDDFDIVGGSLQTNIETGQLHDLIKDLHENDSLSVETLPTYEEEVKKELHRIENELEERTQEFDDEIQNLLRKLGHELKVKSRKDTKARSVAFEKVHTGDLLQEDSGGRFSQIKGVMSKDSVDKSLLRKIDTEMVDDNTVERIAEEILGDPEDDGLIENKDYIVEVFEEEIDQIIENQRVRLVQTVVDGLEEIRNSKAYQRSRRDK